VARDERRPARAGRGGPSRPDSSSKPERSGSSGPPRGGRGRAAALGLAATSLALLAGRSVASRPVPAAGALGSDVPRDAETSERKAPTWDLTVTSHERVDFFIEFLMGRNYDKTRKWLERMGKYAPLIQNELRERGMPQDLLYLAMIESGLSPDAYSRAHAAGMWQFIEETGERHGLEVTQFVDERRDPVKSTAAALDYLQAMYDRFDSWYLAAAGYNTGENRVGRLMREQTGSEKGADAGYWDIWDRLPSETRDYVPLMLAMGHIAKDPSKYGFHGLEPQTPLRFEEVVVPGGTQLADVASAADVEFDTVRDLNPQLVRKQTPPERRWAVRVPIGRGRPVQLALGDPSGAAPEDVGGIGADARRARGVGN
jgi:membrane-bound lytic murein transglycosylase D